MNLHDLFAIPCLERPDSVALEFRAASDARSQVWSYAELFGEVEQLAAGLQAWGLHKGDRVALFAGNSPQYVISCLAVERLGGVVVPVNARYQRTELLHILADCKPRVIVTERALLPLVQSVLAAGSQAAALIVVDEIATWQGDASSLRPPIVDGDDLALIMYTSGTTGRSKGAMLSHNAILATVTGLLTAWSWSATDRLLLVLPLFHTHGLVVGMHCALAAGATTLLRPNFDAERTVDALIAGEATCFFGVPTIYTRLVNVLQLRPVADRAAFARVRLFCSGSAPLTPETFNAFRALTGHAILERYGMSETGMNLSNPYAGTRLAGSVGTPLPGVSARVVNPDDAQALTQDVTPGDEGELLICGANLFSGYWNAPEKSAESFCVDEAGRRWFRTGDLARRDPETGYVILLGRKHDLVISGGFNIYPREVEEALARFPGVREASVIGVPDDLWGERLEAWIACDDTVDEAALAAWCRAQLASFKCPHRFHRVDDLPRNAMGKVQKDLLRQANSSVRPELVNQHPADDLPTTVSARANRPYLAAPHLCHYW